MIQPNIGRLDDWYAKHPGVIRDPKASWDTLFTSHHCYMHLTYASGIFEGMQGTAQQYPLEACVLEGDCKPFMTGYQTLKVSVREATTADLKLNRRHAPSAQWFEVSRRLCWQGMLWGITMPEDLG